MTGGWSERFSAMTVVSGVPGLLQTQGNRGRLPNSGEIMISRKCKPGNHTRRSAIFKFFARVVTEVKIYIISAGPFENKKQPCLQNIMMVLYLGGRLFWLAARSFSQPRTMLTQALLFWIPPNQLASLGCFPIPRRVLRCVCSSEETQCIRMAIFRLSWPWTQTIAS